MVINAGNVKIAGVTRHFDKLEVNLGNRDNRLLTTEEIFQRQISWTIENGFEQGTFCSSINGYVENSTDEIEVIPICSVKWRENENEPVITEKYNTPGDIILYNRMGVVE